MPIKYFKLFYLLNRAGLKKTQLLELANISPPTLAKLSKGETVTTEIIEKICSSLGVQPGDIMEYIPDKEGSNDSKAFSPVGPGDKDQVHVNGLGISLPKLGDKK